MSAGGPVDKGSSYTLRWRFTVTEATARGYAWRRSATSSGGLWTLEPARCGVSALITLVTTTGDPGRARAHQAIGEGDEASLFREPPVAMVPGARGSAGACRRRARGDQLLLRHPPAAGPTFQHTQGDARRGDQPNSFVAGRPAGIARRQRVIDCLEFQTRRAPLTLPKTRPIRYRRGRPNLPSRSTRSTPPSLVAVPAAHAVEAGTDRPRTAQPVPGFPEALGVASKRPRQGGSPSSTTTRPSSGAEAGAWGGMVRLVAPVADRRLAAGS